MWEIGEISSMKGMCCKLSIKAWEAWERWEGQEIKLERVCGQGISKSSNTRWPTKQGNGHSPKEEERERNAPQEERERELVLALDLGERGINTYKAEQWREKASSWSSKAMVECGWSWRGRFILKFYMKAMRKLLVKMRMQKWMKFYTRDPLYIVSEWSQIWSLVPIPTSLWAPL